MATYKEWNKAIYKYFFQDKSLDNNFLFSVTENDINIIGAKLNLQDPIRNFVETIRTTLIVDGYNSIKLKDNDKVNIETNNSTAIIAFFILIAGLVGKKNQIQNQEETYKIRNISKDYWGTLKKYIQDYTGIKYKSTGIFRNYNEDAETLDKMFKKFAEHIQYEYNIKFKFTSIYNRKDKRDIVGLPYSQAMITSGDIERLYYIFTSLYGKDKKDIKRTDVDKKIVKIKGFSTIFNIIYKNSDNPYKKKLDKRIDNLCDNWIKDPIYTDIDKTGKYIKHPTILLGFYEDNRIYQKNFHFGITARKSDELNGIEFKHNSQLYNMEPSDSQNYYKLIDNFFSTNANYKDKLFTQYVFKPFKKDMSDKQYIFFKKDERTENWIQTPQIYQGDTFSILATEKFFDSDFDSEYIEDFLEPADANQENWNIPIKITQFEEELYLLHNVKAEREDGNIYIKLSTKDKLILRKGLKINRDTYISQALPVIYINDLNSIKISEINYEDYFDETDYKDYCEDILLNLSEKLEKQNKHLQEFNKISIEYNNSGKRVINIGQISEVMPNDNKNSLIFHILQNNHSKKHFKNNESEQKYIIGALYSGLTEKCESERIDEINECKVNDIDEANNDAIKNELQQEKNNKDTNTVQYTVEQLKQIKQRYILELIKLQKKTSTLYVSPKYIQNILGKITNNCDENIVQELRKYLKNNKYTNIVNAYINELRKG